MSKRALNHRSLRLLSSGLVFGSLAWSTPAMTTDSLDVPDAAPTVIAEPPLAPPTISLPPASAPAPTTIREQLPIKNSYIDPTNLGPSAPQQSLAAPEVVLTERKSGCQTTVQNGVLNRGCGNSSPSVARRSRAITAIVPRRQSLTRSRVSSQSLISRAPGVSPLKPLNFGTHRYQSYTVGRGVSPQQVISLDPMVRRGLSIALAPMPEYSRATSLYPVSAPQSPRQGTDLIFPVSGSATITSAFGWRVHPISKSQRMHQGTDIGAPLGTPVIAAYAGEVAQADWAGGYGLMVVLRHLEGTQESRYAHLSEIFVQPAQQVQQGEIIGRVGSTGFSTGPHLHFEWRHLTNEGWVAVDAGTHLQFALDNLMQAQQVALAPTPVAPR